jgi:dihydropyrimidinase
MSTLIRNGRIITAEQDYIGDIYIEMDKITTIGVNLQTQADKVIDAQGKYVIPGGVDVHTHLDMPFGGTVSSDDFETGTRAAAFGGTTCLVDFAIQSKGQKMREALDIWWKKGEKATTDYSLHMIITDLPEAHLEDMNEMVREGLTSFKLFMAYPNVLMVDDATIYRALRQTGQNGALVCMHAENGSVIDLLVQKAVAEGKAAPIYHALTRPTTAEGEAVNRAIALAQMAGAPVYIVHLSTADALEKVAEARDKGVPAFAETCPQYLLLSIEDLERPNFEGAKYVFTPPLREKWHQEKLWEGLRKNTLQVVSTDNRWVELLSTAPAKMFGLYPRKGAISIGSDADIVIWDPNKEHTISAKTHHMNVDYSMFEGFKVKGNVEIILSRGETIVDKEKWLGKAGRGQFLKRDTYAGAWK